jgi:thiamine-monophosphate kinase
VNREPLGEFELIEEIRARLGAGGERLVLGSGDDAAIARCDGVVVTSVDAFVEGVHFRFATTSMRDLGHKCLAAAVSDIAAMGAAPGEAYIALGVPGHIAAEEVLQLAEGAAALAGELGVALAGGDLTRSAELFVAVTATGHAGSEQELVRRDGASAGELVGVTGVLGGSGAGLLLLERKLTGLDPQVGAPLIERHLRPRPLLEAGRALARAGVTTMVDVSDGIASDCVRLAERSGVALDVRIAALPLDEGVAEVAAAAGVDAVELAAGAGEDYELLFTAGRGAVAEVEAAASAAGAPVTWIGDVREGSAVRLLDEAGRERPLQGWDHFAGGPPRAAPGRA